MVTATSSQQADNERVRITQWRLPPGGGETGWHRHEFDYAIVPITDGVLTIVGDSGSENEFPLSAGVSYFRQAGVEHNVKNNTSDEIVFVEVEVK